MISYILRGQPDILLDSKEGITIDDFGFKTGEKPESSSMLTGGSKLPGKMPAFGGGSKDENSKSSMDSSVAGIAGGRPTSINITIGSLIKENVNQITTVKGDADLGPFMEKLKAALLTMVNDSHIIAG